MRRVCLTLPTHRACTETITAVAGEAAYGARHFGVEVHLLVLDSSTAPERAAHRAALAALPPAPGVVVHHLDEAEQRRFLREVITRAGVARPERILDLMLPSAVSYGACTNRAFLLAEALGCASVHRRDSDSRYQERDGRPVFPIHHELTALGLPAADVAPLVTRSRLDPAAAHRPVALVGGSFTGEMSVDVAEIRRLDPAVYREVIGLSVPDGYPEIWRRNLIDEAFRGAGTPFTTDRTTLTHVSPTRVDMCNIALDREVYARVPLPPATDTIGSDYFLLHLVHDARLPGVLHNRHIVNYHTGERRSDAGFLAYQWRFAKYLLSTPHFEDVYARLTEAGDRLLDERGRLRAAAVATRVRAAADLGPADGNAGRLDVLDRCYRALGGRYADAADLFAARRARLLAEARADMADFALLVDAWAALTAHARRTPPKAPRTATVTLAHSGGENRRGPLTMGQANMIRCVLRDEPGQINIHDVWPVPAGTGTEDALDALRALVVRHEALRTTFPHTPGAAPREQVVAAEGTFTVTVLDHDELPADGAQYAEELARAARDTRFHLDRDFPLRVTLVTRAGAPRHLALAASHAATDGSALALLRDEWLTLLAGGKLPDPADSTTLTPLALAAQETSPAGRRTSEASLRHWERVLRTGPQAMFAEPAAHGTETRAPGLTLRSRRGAHALARIAARTGALPTTALLTAWCALLAHRAGQPVCVAAVPTANRFQSRLARTIAPLSQDALLALDVQAAPSFDALLRKAWGAALKAYRHSQFDADRLWDMIGRVTRERGSHFARDIVFNDISALPATLAGAAPPDATAPDLELTWGPAQPLPSRVLTFVHETAPVLRLATWTDPALFPREQAEGLATGLVRLLEAAADGDVPLGSLTGVTGVRPAERGADWVRVDGCWVSPPAVADTLSRVLGGRPAHVEVDADGSLVAYLAAGAEPPTPAEAHRRLMDALPGRPGVLAPRRYVIVADAPATTGADRGGAWPDQPILTEGTGREAADAT
ncbi:DUF6271 family protein [Streptomyces sp. NPDC004267]|uniref:DUF6271 family protein n=1 Tax=Streptomyces sp. NPDC004267 TaxID=3364694 RepID=UPI00367FFB9A